MGFDAQTRGNHVGVPFYGQSMPQFHGSMPQFDGSMPQFMLGSPFPIPPANDKCQGTHAQAMPQLNGSLSQFMLGSSFPIPYGNDKGQGTHAQVYAAFQWVFLCEAISQRHSIEVDRCVL